MESEEMTKEEDVPEALRGRRRSKGDNTHGVEEFILKDDEPNITFNAPDIEASTPDNYNGVRVIAVEMLVGQLAKEFYEFRDMMKDPKGFPRVEVLVDSNCLMTYTGPMEHFDKDYFRDLLSQTIAGRLNLEEAKPVPVCEGETTTYHG